MGIKRYVAFPAVLAMLVVMAGATPAQATVFAKDHFAFEESFEEDLCGIAVRHGFAVSGHFRTRTGKGELDQAFFGQSSVEFTDTFTNLATGASFSIEGRLTGIDVKATPSSSSSGSPERSSFATWTATTCCARPAPCG